jgi:tetratricopeptide (TPR) repeat protein
MDQPLPDDLALALDTPRLLLLGTRQFPDAERLEWALGAPGRRLRRVTPWPFDYDQVPASPAERTVLGLCRRSVALDDLMALPYPRPHLVRAIYALLVGGMVEDDLVEAPAAALEPLPSPQTAEEAERAARGLLEKGQRQRAMEILQEALERHPDALGPRRLLAMTRGRESGYQPEVEKLLLSTLEKAPHDAELRYALASFYRRAGMTARAMLQLRLVLSADSGHAAAYRDLGELEAEETRRAR